MVPRNIGKKYINGINAATCRTRVIILEAAGFPIDWKNVVASITNPNTGANIKLALRAGTPIFKSSSPPPNIRIIHARNN